MNIKVKVKTLWRASETTDASFNTATIEKFTDYTQINVPPAPLFEKVRVFADSADGKLKVRKSDGTIVDLESGGGSGSSQHNLLDSAVHPDTASTTVQRGMLIVGQLVAGIVKWAGLALGAAGKVLKSDGTDAIWGNVDWTEITNKPSTFPPSAHTHLKADITDFAHTHPLSDLQQSGATTGQVPKWSGTSWVAGNVDWTEITNKPTTFPPSAHTHPPADITPQGHGSGLNADTVDGIHASSFEQTSNKGQPNGYAPLDNAGKLPTTHLPTHSHSPSDITPQGHGSGLDADTLDGVHASSLVPTTRQINTGVGLTGGGDLSQDRTLSVVDNTTVQKVEVAQGGTLVATRKRLNFIAGTNVTISVTDDAINDKADITISATGAGGGSGVGVDVYPKILFPAGSYDDTTNAALLEMVTYTNGSKQEVLRYSKATTPQQRWWEAVVLDAANFSGQFKIRWSCNVAAGSDGDAVVWEVGVGVVNVGSSLDVSLTTATATGTRDANESANIMKETTVTVSGLSVSNGSKLVVRIRRLSDNTSDTNPNAVRLHQVVMD